MIENNARRKHVPTPLSRTRGRWWLTLFTFMVQELHIYINQTTNIVLHTNSKNIQITKENNIFRLKKIIVWRSIKKLYCLGIAKKFILFEDQTRELTDLDEYISQSESKRHQFKSNLFRSVSSVILRVSYISVRGKLYRRTSTSKSIWCHKHRFALLMYQLCNNILQQRFQFFYTQGHPDCFFCKWW
jgi:hypothetical protein